ncbi:P-loop containing nucleoside triphosphate hydrolase protein [Dipodascopsis tothii]|uniref:P-loop containing nucleoside triphosphate hydrolase protein n=1 Tax=Dipodascopsis tothii TaxID=44089 RepID=UPI0034CFC71A
MTAIYIHSFALYLAAFFVAVLDARSAVIRRAPAAALVLAALHTAVAGALTAVGLLSPVRPIPAYVEVLRGLEPCRETYASLYSLLTFSFLNDIVATGYRKTLELGDLWDLDDDLRTANVLTQFRAQRRASSLVLAIFRFLTKELVISTAWSLAYVGFSLTPSVVIKAVLEYVESPARTPAHMGYFFVAVMVVAAVGNAVAVSQSSWGFRRVSMKLRCILVAEIYAKALRRRDAKDAAAAKKDDGAPDRPGARMSSGSVINLMSVDAFMISEAAGFMYAVIRAFLLLIVACVWLYRIMGTSAFAGMAVMAAAAPVNYYTSRLFGRIQAELMETTDRRIEKTNEVLQSIKIIKFFAWEPRFRAAMLDIRRTELGHIYRRYLVWALSVIVWFGLPLFMTLATFLAHTVLAGRELTPAVAFSAVSVFNLIRTPIDSLTDVIYHLMDAVTSLRRVQTFFGEDETTKYDQLAAPRGRDAPYIGFDNATFSWGSGESAAEFQLRGLSVAFQVGRLNLVVGPTGCGKTSMLLALLGEMTLLGGQVFLPSGEAASADGEHTESVAYCAQHAWLLNDTIRNNILFDSGYNKQRYAAVVRACALTRDLEILDAGDETVVGEKGIALSGGQKQRISLARALYSHARHVILDDCLSAIDSHSAAWIYEHGIRGELMAGRTCILVSHNVALTLAGAAHVVIMDNGRIRTQGSPMAVAKTGALGSDDLVLRTASQAASRPPSHTSLVDHSDPVGEPTATAREPVPAPAPAPAEVDEEAMVVPSLGGAKLAETQQEGAVTLRTYWRYLSAMGSAWYWALVVALVVAHQLAVLGQSLWIRQWASAGDTAVTEAAGRRGPLYYCAVYAAVSLVYVGLSFLREGVVFFGSLRASRQIFENLLDAILRATPRFFDTTPVGRIINRFSKDIEAVDLEVAATQLSIVQGVVSIAAILIMISAIIPSFLFAAALISMAFVMVNVYYVKTSREVRRISSTTRSPIFQHFGETMAGISTIRAYGYEARFILKNMDKLDTNTRPYYVSWASGRWMSFRSDSLGGLVTAATALFIVLSARHMDSGLAGLSLTYSAMFSENVLWLLFTHAQNEINMNSVERVNEYIDVDQEAPAVVAGHRVPPDWPSKGEIVVDNLSLRYAPELPLVISNITFVVQSCWKVGVVGRTGAGKSTIASAFFRFLEPDSGRILIDGIDIASIGLDDLRQGLTIIPQDPTLFTGTIRSNLDPFDRYSDADIFLALRRVRLIDDELAGPSTADGARNVNVFYDLASAVTEGGANLSQGQRQLMCLARSLLKAPKVILLDEATASIDYDTDKQIQDTIRDEFANTTVLTIAHRLRSIIDYDMILVLDHGTIKEFDRPHSLLQQPDSLFRSMCESSGELAKLETLAAQAFHDQVLAV